MATDARFPCEFAYMRNRDQKAVHLVPCLIPPARLAHRQAYEGLSKHAHALLVMQYVVAPSKDLNIAVVTFKVARGHFHTLHRQLDKPVYFHFDTQGKVFCPRHTLTNVACIQNPFSLHPGPLEPRTA